jgi:cyanate permease
LQVGFHIFYPRREDWWIIAGFVAPYVTGAVKDATGSYVWPMVIVGAVMLLSGILWFAIAREETPKTGGTAPCARIA